MANWIDEPKVEDTTQNPQVPETQTQEPVQEPVKLDQEWVPTTGLTPLKVEEPVEVAETPEPVVEPEPTVVAPEVTVEPTVEEVTVEEKAPIVTEAPKQPDTKVETVQDIKAKETSNEAQENELNEKKKTQVVTEMQQMIQNGSTLEEIQAFWIKNNQFRDDINTVLRGSFKNVSNTAYFGKYSTLNNEDMYAAYQKGEVVPWSEQYNLLPDAQRARFDAFLSEKNAVNVVKKTDYSTSDKVTDMTKLESAIPQMFSSNVRTKYEEKLNNPRIKELSSELTQNKVEIDDIDDSIADLEEEVERQAWPWALTTQLNSRYKQEYKFLMKKKRLLLRERQISLWEYQSLKSDAETELKISMYEDGIAREQYQTELSLYNQKRARWEEIEDRDFKIKTQIQAEERQRNFTIEMKELDQKLKEQNKTWTYSTDRDWNMLYVVNGKAEKVRDADWKVVWVTQKKNEYSESIQKNSDWTYSIFRTYTDWRKPEMYNYGIDWDSSYNTQLWIYDAISWLDKKGWKWFNWETWKLQCWEAANRYMKTVGIDKRVWDSYDSKKALINNNWPQVWGLAVWNPNAEGKFWEFGHIGMVTWYNPENWEVEITDWNKDWDGLKNTYNIPVSQVLNSDGWFVHLEWSTKPEISWFDEVNIPLYKRFLSDKWLTSTQEKWIEDIEAFKTQALAYSKSLTKQWTPQIKRIIELAKDLKENRPWRAARLFSETPWGTLTTTGADYQSSLQAFISNNALGNLVQLKKEGATFGALSNQELQFLEKSATELSSWLSDEKFDRELDRIVNLLSKWLWEEEVETIDTIKKVTSFADYQSYKQTPTGSTWVNQDILDLYSNN